MLSLFSKIFVNHMVVISKISILSSYLKRLILMKKRFRIFMINLSMSSHLKPIPLECGDENIVSVSPNFPFMQTLFYHFFHIFRIFPFTTSYQFCCHWPFIVFSMTLFILSYFQSFFSHAIAVFVNEFSLYGII